ncbi:hypothetical protein EMCG_01281 [[Emmonsia] crescens]|uniref:Uncharacterized protein n=1 Tax=[Emmonsia] crescens TaxID=73230 RepID=A0A0G2I4I3_9EURO|nr:hypothetical protein EMCG_01281 [Emmonsia crescens UAMH 3008]
MAILCVNLPKPTPGTSTQVGFSALRLGRALETRSGSGKCGKSLMFPLGSLISHKMFESLKDTGSFGALAV